MPFDFSQIKPAKPNLDLPGRGQIATSNARVAYGPDSIDIVITHHRRAPAEAFGTINQAHAEGNISDIDKDVATASVSFAARNNEPDERWSILGTRIAVAIRDHL